MKIGILHISDLHIENDSFLDRVDLIASANNYEVNEISHLYIALSGDIVKSGRKKEFDKAKIFIQELKKKIKPKNSLLNIDFVMVPGNHDCCFDNVKATRKSIISHCKKEDVLEEEDYFIDAMAVQENFWNFYKEITEEKIVKKVSYKKEFQPYLNYKIVFHCYNSSWMSEKDETYGNIVIPENKFLNNDDGEFIISLFHHPLEWLSPNTKNNNKLRFEEHLIKTSNIVLYGHEHDKGRSKNISQKNNSVVFCGAKAFDKKNIKETGFAFYEIDLNKKSTDVKVYKWNTDKYVVEFEEKYETTEKVKREFLMSPEFEKKINSLNIPLKHSKKERLLLSDVFIYPDLEPLDETLTVVQYPNSEELIDQVKDKDSANILIEGEDQSGKTTLFFVLLKRFYDIGYTPVYIRGKHIKNTDVKNIVKIAVKEQYGKSNMNLFFQQKKRILFLDNFHKLRLNAKYRKNLLNNLYKHFDYILISADNSLGSNLATEEAISLKDFDKYKLLPFGHEKRNKLIEQWLLIGENQMTINDEVLMKNVQGRFDEINSLIGNRLMPSYPIFILTLLQGLDANIIAQDYSQTSYAHVYYALITAGLVREGVKSNLTSYLNILKELAFYLFNKKVDSFSQSNFENFYKEYEESYYKDFSADTILSTLTRANIIKYDDEYYSFSYKYIFFYLVAQKISSEIDKHKKLIEDLSENIHLEKNANILIFLSHHSKAQLLIDNVIFTSLIPFENTNPITLDKNDDFVSFITEFAKEIQDNIIEERDPKKEVNKELKTRDEIERNGSKENTSNEDNELMPKEVIELNHAFRSVKIIGQIVKNQKGDFKKDKLVELVEVAYSTVFRFIGFFSEILTKDKDELIKIISEEVESKTNSDRNFIEKTVKKLLQFISWRICIDSFTNLMFSVGTKGRNELYDTVSKKMGSTASKIVSFAIKSYYEKINVKELKQLFDEIENNYLAQSILRVYVRKHLYTNIIDRAKKDQIIKIAGFKPQAMVKQVKHS